MTSKQFHEPPGGMPRDNEERYVLYVDNNRGSALARKVAAPLIENGTLWVEDVRGFEPGEAPKWLVGTPTLVMRDHNGQKLAIRGSHAIQELHTICSDALVKTLPVSGAFANLERIEPTLDLPDLNPEEDRDCKNGVSAADIEAYNKQRQRTLQRAQKRAALAPTSQLPTEEDHDREGKIDAGAVRRYQEQRMASVQRGRGGGGPRRSARGGGARPHGRSLATMYG